MRSRIRAPWFASVVLVAATGPAALGCSVGVRGSVGSGAPTDGPPAAAARTTAPIPPDPSRRGPFAIGYLEATLTDPERPDRPLPLSIWYPVDEPAAGAPATYDILPALSLPTRDVRRDVAVAAGRHPVLIFSHGSGASRLLSWFLTETLASHGFVVVAPDHLGNTFADSSNVQGLDRTASERPKDVRVIVDELFDPRRLPDGMRAVLDAHLDLDRIGVVGHSYGGYTALASAGGTTGDRPDVRIKAVAALEPLSDRLPDENLRRITIPVLLMGGTLDRTTPIEPMVTRPFALIAAPERVRVDLAGADHESFTILCATDLLLEDPTITDSIRARARQYFGGSCGPEVAAPAMTEALIDRFVVAFFAVHLNHDARYESFLASVGGAVVSRP